MFTNLKLLIVIIVGLLTASTAFAQLKHNTMEGSTCKYAKNRCKNLEGCPVCYACNAEDAKAEAIKVAEEKRLKEAQLERDRIAKANKDAAFAKQRALDANKPQTGQLLINGQTSSNTNTPGTNTATTQSSSYKAPANTPPAYTAPVVQQTKLESDVANTALIVNTTATLLQEWGAEARAKKQKKLEDKQASDLKREKEYYSYIEKYGDRASKGDYTAVMILIGQAKSYGKLEQIPNWKELIISAAEHNNIHGLRVAGRLGLRSITEKDPKPLIDVAKGINYYERAANLGDPQSMLLLAICYASPEYKVQNLELAAKWLDKAYQLGYYGALQHMADFYKEGKFYGLKGPKDSAKYLEVLFRLANGNAYSPSYDETKAVRRSWIDVYMLYYKGKYVKKDRALSKQWEDKYDKAEAESYSFVTDFDNLAIDYL